MSGPSKIQRTRNDSLLKGVITLYSPINKYEFFIVVFVNSNHGLYCSSHSKMTVYRIEVGHYQIAPEPEGHGR